MQYNERKSLSKFMSLVLRHKPQDYGLKLDRDGFVRILDLVEAIRKTNNRWAVQHRQAIHSAIEEVVRECNKNRYEIIGQNIRARYGHSDKQKVQYPETEPPDILFHGTSPQALTAIRSTGLLPMSRQYVHLSETINLAQSVGGRHTNKPITLKVQAKKAWKNGVKFYGPFRGKGDITLYMSDPIPVDYLEADELGTDNDRFSRIGGAVF